MDKRFSILICGIIFLVSVGLKADDNCVKCGPKEMVGMPVDKGFAALEKIAKVPVAGTNKKVNQQDLLSNYCIKFLQIPSEMVGTLIEEMEDTSRPDSPDQYFTTPECQPKGYSAQVKSPLLHYVADDPETRQDFLNTVWLYYSKKRKNENLFKKAINSKNTKGETLLDYIESLRLRDINSDEGQQEPLRKVIQFLCSHGGVYSFHSNKKCNNGSISI